MPTENAGAPRNFLRATLPADRSFCRIAIPLPFRARSYKTVSPWSRGAASVSKSVRKRSAKRKSPVRSQPREPRWVHYDDQKLLQMRICDLDLRIKGSEIEVRIERLYEELAGRNLNFRPHFWFSEEWFCPDGIPGIAVAFCLAHPRLMRLEKKQMLEVEGGTEEWCMRILRHEAGHAIDNAYGLHRRKSWRSMFGKYTQPYPDTYQPRPYSKSYVLHLDPWYAQSHPAEDFAETFAVWLKPRSRWRTQYEGWPARKKLEYVDALMEEIDGKKPLVSSRKTVDKVDTLRTTLAEHYAAKRARYSVDLPTYYDRELRRLFSDAPEHRSKPSASGFLRRIRPELRQMVARWTGQYQYTIDQILGDIIQRCRELNLRLAHSERQARKDALAMVTAQTMNYLHAGHHRFAL